MKSFGQLKIEARTTLRGTWGSAILLLLLLLLPQVLLGIVEEVIRSVAGIPVFENPAATASMTDRLTVMQAAANASIPAMLVTLLMGILSFLIAMPLRQGMYRWFWNRAASGERESAMGVFHYFETGARFGGALWLHFSLGMRLLLWSLLFSLPVGALAGMLFYYNVRVGRTMEFGFIQPLFWALLLMWICLTGLLLCVVALRYFLAPFLRAEFPAEKTGHLIKKSVRLMRGHKGRVFLFKLTFALWFLPLVAMVGCLVAALLVGNPYGQLGLLLGALGALVLQLGIFVYLLPYRNMAMTVCAREILQGGTFADEDMENVTREYLYKSLGDSLGEAFMPGKENPLWKGTLSAELNSEAPESK